MTARLGLAIDHDDRVGIVPANLVDGNEVDVEKLDHGPVFGPAYQAVGRSLDEPADVRECLTLDDLGRFARVTNSILVDREVIGYAVALADATRNPRDYGMDDLDPYIAYGASPQGSLSVHPLAEISGIEEHTIRRESRPPRCNGGGAMSRILLLRRRV